MIHRRFSRSTHQMVTPYGRTISAANAMQCLLPASTVMGQSTSPHLDQDLYLYAMTSTGIFKWRTSLTCDYTYRVAYIFATPSIGKRRHGLRDNMVYRRRNILNSRFFSFFLLFFMKNQRWRYSYIIDSTFLASVLYSSLYGGKHNEWCKS